MYMKVILSFTTIPPRFKYIQSYIENLKNIDNYKEIWINIPKKYNRFPDWDGKFPYTDFGVNVIINRDCDDLGPGTSAFAPIINGTNADILIVVNDDTIYPKHMITHLLDSFLREGSKSVWGLSGFNFETYLKGNILGVM